MFVRLFLEIKLMIFFLSALIIRIYIIFIILSSSDFLINYKIAS